MKRISTKMKLLSLAILGLGGMALAGSASAACPSSLSPPWTAALTGSGYGGTADAVTGGLDGSSCKLQVSLDGSATAFSNVGVLDTSPSNEPTYRFRIYVDARSLGAMNSFDTVQFFSANAANSFPATGGASQMLRLAINGGGSTGKMLAAAVACNVPANSYVCVQAVDLPDQVNWIEGELTKGASGSLKLWINKTAESDPTAISMNVDNAGWNGVDAAILGLLGPQGNVLSNQAGRTLYLDSFDSRRQTFIGQ